MSTNFTADKCPLCGLDAQSKETRSDGGNRQVFLCKNPECGKSEIYRGAKEKIEKCTNEKKQEFQQKANACESENMLLKITLNNDGGLESKCIPQID